MKKHFIISLFVMAVAAAISIFNSFAYGISGITFVFGTVSCIGGLVCLVLAAIIGLFRDLKNGKGDKELAKAFLMAAGITFLIGTGVCSTMLLG